MIKLKFYVAVVAATALVACKNDAKTGKDATLVEAVENVIPADTTPEEDKGEKVQIRLNVPDGLKQQFTYRVQTDEFDQSCIFDFVIKPRPMQDTVAYNFFGTLKRITYKGTYEGRKEEYDSASGVNTISGAFAGSYDDYLNKEFRVVAGNRNTIVRNFKYLDEPYKPHNQIIEFNHYYIPFPEAPIAVGHTWQGSYKNFFDEEMPMEFVLKEITVDRFVVKVAFYTPGQAKSGRAEGDYVFDRKTGLLLHGKLKGKSMTIELTSKIIN